eukprot:4916712-Amphidinium_carterae.1
MSICSLLGDLDTHMFNAVDQTDPTAVLMSSMVPDAADKARALYAMLLQVVHGKALTLLLGSERQNGFPGLESIGS